MIFVNKNRYPSVEKIILQDNYYKDDEKRELLKKINNVRSAIEFIPIVMLYEGNEFALKKFKEMSKLQDNEIEQMKNKLQEEKDFTSNITKVESQIDEIIKTKLLENFRMFLEKDNAWTIAVKLRVIKKWMNNKSLLKDCIETEIISNIYKYLRKGLDRLWDLRNIKSKGWSSEKDDNEIKNREGLNVYDTAIVINIIYSMIKENNDLIEKERQIELITFIMESIYEIDNRIRKENGGCFANELYREINVEALGYALSSLITICKAYNIEGFLNQKTYSDILDTIQSGLNFLEKNDDLINVCNVATKLHIYKRVSSILPFFNEQFNLGFHIKYLQNNLLDQIKFRNNFYGWVDEKDINILSIKNTSLAFSSLIRSGVDYQMPIVSQIFSFMHYKAMGDTTIDSLDFSYILCAIIDYINVKITSKRHLSLGEYGCEVDIGDVV